MEEKSPEAFIKVSEGGVNFKMIDCEFHLGESGRPALETKASGTKIIGTLISSSPVKPPAPKPSFWFHPLMRPILYIVGGVALAAILAIVGLK